VSQSPVVIIGMHRSGTTMLSKVLENMGIYMGWRKDENNEALFFLKFNDWILKQANATWDNPYNYKIADEDFKKIMIGVAERYINSFRLIEYLGFFKYLKYRTLKNLDFPWGWKDPRNTFTIDVWLKVFPNMKIIHIYRNPIDVAESLRKRNLMYRSKFAWNLKKEIKLLIRRGFIGYGDSARVINIYEGIKLWEEYVTKAFELGDTYNLNILHIKYEDFLESPFENVRKILDTIDVDYNEDRIRQVVQDINPKRKYAFLSKKELADIYKTIKNDKLVVKLGYGNL
jgi:hypothetical protein